LIVRTWGARQSIEAADQPVHGRTVGGCKRETGECFFAPQQTQGAKTRMLIGFQP
jgi:hypothetical protein